MTTKELLRLVRLLAALESVMLMNKQIMPDYLHDDLCECVDILEKKITEKSNDQ